MANLAVLASGTGSNLVALLEAVAGSPHNLACLVCDVIGAPVVEKAATRGISSHVVTYSPGARDAAEREIASVLESYKIDVIALAGFMKILSPTFVTRYQGRIVNVHPSLLPCHPGRNAIERSWMSEDPKLGVTVHLVDEGVDTGPILAQQSFCRNEVTNMQEAEVRIHALEHQLFPMVVLQMLDHSTMPQRSTR